MSRQQRPCVDSTNSQALCLQPIPQHDTNPRGYDADVEAQSLCSEPPVSLLQSHPSCHHARENADESDLDSDVENDFVKTINSANRHTPRWKYLLSMAVRRRRSPGQLHEEYKHNTDHPLLASGLAARRSRRRGTSWYNWCIFGGISGAGLFAVLLSINLTLSLLTLYWYPDIDQVLRYWGTAGSGTEGLAWYPTDFTRDVIPIPCHSHNDYWRKVPLFSALRAGCTGVEADVWLFDDDLYVGHNTASLTRNRTFQSLYINPLVKILEGQNPTTDFYNGTNHGVFDTDPEKSVVLLVDLKTSGPETWPYVLSQLQPLRDRGWLTYMEAGIVYHRQVTIVGTGNTPFNLVTENATYRDAFFDAPLETMYEPLYADSRTTPSSALSSSPGIELDEHDTPEQTKTASEPLNNLGQGLSGTTALSNFNQQNSYYASVAFGKAIGRIWRGRLSTKQMATIRGQVSGAHRRGLKVRYWDLPSWPIGLRNHVYDVLMREGVDVLNVDDLRAASRHVW